MQEEDMGNFLVRRTWSPYWAGAIAGILAVTSVIASTKMLSKPKYIGASTTFVRAAGFIERQISKEHTENNDYFTAQKIKVDWQMMFVVGIFLGALISSVMGKTYQKEFVPPIWKERFGDRPFIRAIWAFAGGIVALFGARLAGGCPSGHGLSGVMQFSISGLIAIICFVIAGVVTARVVYKGGK